MIKCQLCGYEYETENLACHRGCPLASRCAVICCPSCGYQVVDESRSQTAGLIRKTQSVWMRWRLEGKTT